MDSLFCYHIVLLFVAAIAFCLLWIGFATPGWFVVTVQEETARKEYTVSSVNRYALIYFIFVILSTFDMVCASCLEQTSESMIVNTSM